MLGFLYHWLPRRCSLHRHRQTCFSLRAAIRWLRQIFKGWTRLQRRQHVQCHGIRHWEHHWTRGWLPIHCRQWKMPIRFFQGCCQGKDKNIITSQQCCWSLGCYCSGSSISKYRGWQACLPAILWWYLHQYRLRYYSWSWSPRCWIRHWKWPRLLHRQEFLGRFMGRGWIYQNSQQW